MMKIEGHGEGYGEGREGRREEERRRELGREGGRALVMAGAHNKSMESVYEKELRGSKPCRDFYHLGEGEREAEGGGKERKGRERRNKSKVNEIRNSIELDMNKKGKEN